jgi:hypothetical protein
MASLDSMDAGRHGWDGQLTTSGGNVPNTIKQWMPAGINRIAVWPVDAAGGTTLDFDGVVVTPTLTDDSDFIDIGSEELGVILKYALHILSFKQGTEAFSKTQGFLQEFHQAAIERNSILAASSPFGGESGKDLNRKTDPTHRMKPSNDR